MGRLFPVPAISAITNTIRASNDYIRGVGGLDEIPTIKIPKIDFSKDHIVIWVPGTNDKFIPSELRSRINLAFPNSTIVMLDYTATWNFSISIPHGIFSLAATLDYINKRKKPGTKVYVVGNSQGALITGEVLSRPEYADIVSKSVLLGHPGISEHHYHDTTKKVVEINHPKDFTTTELDGVDKAEMVKAVDSLMTGDMLKALYLLKVGVKHPLTAAWVAISSLRLLPVPILRDLPAHHDYSVDYSEAVEYLRSGYKE